MTTKFYSSRSNANRALKKAVSGYDAFIVSQGVDLAEQGFYGSIILKSGAGRHLQEFLEEKGMAVEFGVAEAPAYEDVADRDYNAKLALDAYKAKAKAHEAAMQTDDGPVAAEGSEEADDASLAEMLALAEKARLAEEKAAAQPMGEKDLPAADEDNVDQDVVAAFLAGEFRRQFAALGGNEPRGRCKALRALAKEWDGSRKEFIEAAVANGILASTANANYQAGYK